MVLVWEDGNLLAYQISMTYPIHGWDKTISGFILDFYFRFLFLINFRHRRAILHWHTIFRQNREWAISSQNAKKNYSISETINLIKSKFEDQLQTNNCTSRVV